MQAVLRPLSITFLGTCSGGGPTLTRACTATSLNFPQASWLVDCAEGTHHQLLQTKRPYVRTTDVKKVFFTHLHVDHVMGIVSVMKSAMSAHRHSPEENVALQNKVQMELYGPSGLREFIRTNLMVTQVMLAGKYKVHELLLPGDPKTPCEKGEMHDNEAPGKDFFPQGEEAVWKEIVRDKGFVVDVAALRHRIPSFGFVFREEPTVFSPRKVVVLGDTSDPSNIAPLAQGADVLIHEATYTTIPSHLRPNRLTRPPPHRLFQPSRPWWSPSALDSSSGGENVGAYPATPRIPIAVGTESSPSSSFETPLLGLNDGIKELPEDAEPLPGLDELEGDETEEYALNTGHSTPIMAGKFAQRINAQQLYLNHIGTRYPDPGRGPSPEARRDPDWRAKYWRYLTRRAVVDEIERQATMAWQRPNMRAVVASDLMTVPIYVGGLTATPVEKINVETTRDDIAGSSDSEVKTQAVGSS